MDHQYDSVLRRWARLLWLLVLLLPAPRATAQPTHVDTLRIALLLPARESTADSMLVAGVRQGLVEVTRAAALFGGAVNVIPVAISANDTLPQLLRELRLRGV